METKELSSENEENVIELNKAEIFAQIRVNEEFSSGDGITIRKWEGEEMSQYIAEIKKNNVNFIGILSQKLQRDNFGVLTYPNGEKYFGMFQKNKRNKQGFYIYSPIIQEEFKESQFYFGTWVDNKKDGNGTYLWLKEKKDAHSFEDFDKSNFDAFNGLISEDHFVKGTYLKKEGDDYYVYHGTFNENNEKNGDDCFFYNATKDELFYGKVENEQYSNGYLARFDEDGKISIIIYCEFDMYGEVSNFKQSEEIEPKTREGIRNKMFNFRNVILEEDYFGQVFGVFQTTKGFVDEKLNSCEAFNSQEEFPKLMSKSFDFNNITIFKTIEKKI